MSFDIEQDVRLFFEQSWSETEIAWPDDSFIPKDDTWVRFHYNENDGYQASIGSPGNNRFRTLGIVTISIFQKQGQGGVDARAKEGLLKDLFRDGVTSNGISFYDVQSRRVGASNGWYQINVLASFKHDEIT